MDEVPPACCVEGGQGTRYLNPIPAKDNTSAGGQMGAQIREQNLKAGDQFNLETKNVPKEELEKLDRAYQ